MSTEVNHIYEARKALRKVQETSPKKVTPLISIYMGQAWRRSLEVDPTGQNLFRVVDELKELLATEEDSNLQGVSGR